MLGPEFDNIAQQQETDPLSQLMSLNIDPALFSENNENNQDKISYNLQNKLKEDAMR